MMDGSDNDQRQPAKSAARRDRDPALSGLLGVLIAMIFVAGPLAAQGFYAPVAILMPTTLVLIIVLTLHSLPALAVVIGAVVARLATGVIETYTMTPLTNEANAIAAILAMGALIWVVWGVVFGPGRMTAHRVHGAVVLYLAMAILFAWVYRLIAAYIPGAFTGMDFRLGDISTVYPFMYYSLTTLTTLGFGDIVPVNPLARGATTAEAVIGQLYLAIILGRILTLYSDHRKQDP